MSVEYFRIHFKDRPNETYLCGETVAGHVALKLNKEVRLKALEIKFSGRSMVIWSESTYVPFIGISIIFYKSMENYINHTVFALGGNDKEDMTLPPGEYTYDFALTLPQVLPSSFEGKHGGVRYTIKAKIVRPWKTNIETKVAYTVLNLLDLNTLEHVQVPKMATKEKTLCCWCCKSGDVTLAVSLPCTGYVPGQRIQMLLEVDNKTSGQVTLKCNLFQKVIYVATPTRTALCQSRDAQQKETKTILETEELGVVDKMASKNFQSSMVIPSLPASFLNHCNCIYLTYHLQVFADFEGVHMPETLKVPIVIGSIPLRNHFQSVLATDLQVPSTSAATEVATGPSGFPGSSYPGLPPPSYEECVSGGVDIRTEDDSNDLQGDTQFTPRYPMYRFQ